MQTERNLLSTFDAKTRKIETELDSHLKSIKDTFKKQNEQIGKLKSVMTKRMSIPLEGKVYETTLVELLKAANFSELDEVLGQIEIYPNKTTVHVIPSKKVNVAEYLNSHAANKNYHFVDTEAGTGCANTCLYTFLVAVPTRWQDYIDEDIVAELQTNYKNVVLVPVYLSEGESKTELNPSASGTPYPLVIMRESLENVNVNNITTGDLFNTLDKFHVL